MGRVGTTTELRRALKADVYPLLIARNFAIDQRHAPHFIDFRRGRGDRVDFIEFQWEKYGRPRFKLTLGTVSAAGTLAGGVRTSAEDIGPGQAPSYICLYPRGTGSSTRHWFCQDAPFWLRILGRPPRPASQVCAELVALLPEVDDYFHHGKIGLHCFEHANPPFQNVVGSPAAASRDSCPPDQPIADRFDRGLPALGNAAAGRGEAPPDSTKAPTMDTGLPDPIALFFQAHNTGMTERVMDLFTTDAVVSDEAHEYRGAAIKSWIDDAIAKYRPLHAEVAGVVPSGRQTIATAQVSGHFPGSPVLLRYQFTVRDGRIATLSIAP